MKKSCLLLLFIGLFFQVIQAQTISKDERMQWWREAKFGMFIHWGVYAQYAGTYNGHEQAKGGAEWIMNRSKIPYTEYKAIAKQFNPVQFNAEEWVKYAKQAGMKYIVITAKHHDGFAMFKSNPSKWNIVDATPYGKDILKELAAACKKNGIKLGFYYSQAQDWINPGGAASRKLMNEGWANPDSTLIDNFTKNHNGHWDPLQETKSFDEYINEVAVPQVKELLTNYGDVSIMWWDTPVNMTDEAAQKLNELLKLQPQIITNDRLKKPNYPGDTKTPEQKIPGAKELDENDWETCMTMNGTWGFRASDNNWKSSTVLIQNLCDIASKGGNYLLNVGPKADGTFPVQSVERLKEMGEWMDKNKEAIYKTKASPIGSFDWGRCTSQTTKKGLALYLLVFNWPNNGELSIPLINNDIERITVLETGENCTIVKSQDKIKISVPVKAPNDKVSVIKLLLKGDKLNL
jgi:alpha-L-fucosidase